jgi:hypothetical protein
VVYSGTTGFTGGGLKTPVTPVIDTSGNIWIANETSGTISKFNSSGNPVAASGYATAGNTTTYGIVNSHTGLTWVSGSANFSGYTSIGLSTGTASQSYNSATYYSSILEGSDSTIWSVSYVGNSLTSVLSGAAKSHTGGGLSNPTAVAADSTGNIWISNQGANVVSEYGHASGAFNGTGFSGGGIATPWIIAVDGAGSVWVGNNNGTISQLSNTGTALSPSAGFVTPSTLPVYGVAPDASGNIWASDGDGKVYQFIGAGSPTVTPITYNKAGTQP